MEGRTPMERLRKWGLDLPDEFACFPVMLLDVVAVIRAPKGVTMCWPITAGTSISGVFPHLGMERIARSSASESARGPRPGSFSRGREKPDRSSIRLHAVSF